MHSQDLCDFARTLRRLLTDDANYQPLGARHAERLRHSLGAHVQRVHELPDALEELQRLARGLELGGGHAAWKVRGHPIAVNGPRGVAPRG